MSSIVWAAGYATVFALLLGVSAAHGGAGWELASLVVTMGYPLLLLVLAAHAVGSRRLRGPLSVAPLLLLLGGLPGVAAVRSADDAVHDRRFRRHLAEVEAILAQLPLTSGDRLRLPAHSLPRPVRDCCVRVVVRRDSEGHLSAWFQGRRDTVYLYDPSGTRIQRGMSARRWRSQQQLAPDWYRIVRF